MKDQKLIYAMRGIDDDLICEAMKRRNVGLEQDGEEPETVYVTGVRTGRRYPVTAAAVLAVAGALFVVGYNIGISDNFGAVTDEETVESAEETDSGEAFAADDTDTTGEETQPVVSEAVEAVEAIVPYKELHDVYDDPNFYFPTALYVDSYPDIPQPDFGKEYFTEMSTKEILEYYDFHNNFAYYLDSNQIIEIVDENNPHGIYTYPDGSIYDINTFTFELEKKDTSAGHRFHVTIGKKTKFGQEYYEYYKSKGMLASPRSSTFYNEEMDTLFSIFKYYGAAYVMFSATPEEITSDFFADDLDMRESYMAKEKNNLLPPFFRMFLTPCFNCLYDFEGNIYFDRDVELWYNEKENAYFNEETGEWIPAEEWVFD